MYLYEMSLFMSTLYYIKQKERGLFWQAPIAIDVAWVCCFELTHCKEA